uniref:Uncharacterized protein n=1 Tax=Psilocybe cubensis TaxID=181762 RepID=A0A8H8CGM1_PSICU
MGVISGSKVVSAASISRDPGSHLHKDEVGPPRPSITREGVQGKPSLPSHFSTAFIDSSPLVIITHTSPTDQVSGGTKLSIIGNTNTTAGAYHSHVYEKQTLGKDIYQTQLLGRRPQCTRAAVKDNQIQDSDFSSETRAPTHPITTLLTVTVTATASSKPLFISTGSVAPNPSQTLFTTPKTSISSTTTTSNISSTSLLADPQTTVQPSQLKTSSTKVIPISISIVAVALVVTLAMFLIRRRFKRRDEGRRDTIVQLLNADVKKRDHVLNIDPLSSNSTSTSQRYMDTVEEVAHPVGGKTPVDAETLRRMSDSTIASIPSSTQRYMYNVGVAKYPTGGDTSVASGTPRKISWGTISSTQTSAQRLKMEFPLDEGYKTPAYRSTLSYLSFVDDGNQSGRKYC